MAAEAGRARPHQQHGMWGPSVGPHLCRSGLHYIALHHSHDFSDALGLQGTKPGQQSTSECCGCVRMAFRYSTSRWCTCTACRAPFMMSEGTLKQPMLHGLGGSFQCDPKRSRASPNRVPVSRA